MAEEDVVAAEEAEDAEEELEEIEEEEAREVPLPVAPLIRARAVNTGNNKKRKIVHRTSSGRRKDAETKTVPLRKMKAAASLDLSDPSQLTMKEIIRRAEAIERAKAREEAAKKAEEKEKRSSSSSTRAPATERPAAQDTPAPSVLTPQVQIVNGRIVINQQSLVVAAQASTRENTEAYRRVEEDRPKLNYNSYSNRTPVERWKAEDTDLFYKALQQFGTDFELIQNLFPGRTRRQVKAKFKNEEKLNPVRLADALGHKTQVMQSYRGYYTRSPQNSALGWNSAGMGDLPGSSGASSANMYPTNTPLIHTGLTTGAGVLLFLRYMYLNFLNYIATDQSHHYRAIIEMLKTEKADGDNEEEILLDSLLLPSVTDETAIMQQTPGTQASTSADKVDEVVNLEAATNTVVVEKEKSDLRTALASEPMVSIPPESEVTRTTVSNDPPASEATGNPISSHQSNTNSSVNPLGSYGKQTNPLGNYGKEFLSGNPLGSYAKNPLGVYK